AIPCGIRCVTYGSRPFRAVRCPPPSGHPWSALHLPFSPRRARRSLLFGRPAPQRFGHTVPQHHRRFVTSFRKGTLMASRTSVTSMRSARGRHRLAALGLALAALCGVQATAPAAAAEAGLTVTDAVSLPHDDAYPEGMVLDPATGDLFITSFGTGAVYRATPGAVKAKVYLPAGAEGRDHAMGTDIDRHGRLWVNDKAGVTLYEKATGTRLARFVTPAPGSSVLNDLDFTPDGTAYLTDSTGKVVYRLTERQVADAIAAGGSARTLPVGFDLTGVVDPQPEGTLTLNGIEADPTG